MPMSTYYQNLRQKTGNQLLFTPSVGAIIRDASGRILFQDPGGPFWSLPAGAIEPGEPPAKAVIREVYEETGLIVRPVRLIGCFGGEAFRLTYPDQNQVEYIAFIFACDVLEGTLTAIDGESKQLCYFDRKDRPPLALPYPEHIFETGTESSFFEWEEAWIDQLKVQYSIKDEH